MTFYILINYSILYSYKLFPIIYLYFYKYLNIIVSMIKMINLTIYSYFITNY